MSITPLTFTGVSTFSQDFQTIIDRATRIAGLPIKALQNQQADNLQQKILLSNISASAASLATSVSSLGTLGSQKAITAISSNTAKVVASSVSSSTPAVYTLTDITSIAKAAAEASVSGYASSTASPISSTGTVKLTIGSNNYTIDISGDNSLTGLRNVINVLNAGVTASILTTGTGATPYYLSLTATTNGATTLELRDDPTGANVNLITAANQGASTVFKLNGVSVSKTSTLINDVVPGVTFSVLGTTTGSESVSLTLASDRSKLQDGLEDFVDNFNALRDQLNGQVGSNAGLLSGDYLVREIQDRLRSVTAYTGTGSIKGLADLGIEFDTNGVASFNATSFLALSDSQIQGAFDFLGSTTTGFGAFGAKLSEISDSLTGLAKLQLDKYDETDKRLTARIASMTTRLGEAQKTLAQRLQVADALLASLQTQQRVLDASLQSLGLTLYGRNKE